MKPPTMLVGVTVPNIGALTTSGAGVGIAEHAERPGLASVLISERDVDDNERHFPLTGSIARIAAKLCLCRTAGLDPIGLVP
jgi:hypothetical protein